VLHGYGANWTASTPSPAISIVGAYTPINTVFVDCNLNSDGFTAEYFWNGGTQSINYINDCDSTYGYGYGDGINISFAPSSYFGWGAGCWLASSCSTSSSIGAVLGVQGVRLTAQENSGPSVAADGSNNLWYQASRWVRGGGWPVGFTSSDPSGVCGTDLLVHIDETPPSLAFEPVNPSDPQAVVADTSDGQSGVASGQIEMRPAAGGSWQSLATEFDGPHLLARFDDATLAPGKWLVQATSCDNAGNCAWTPRLRGVRIDRRRR